MAVYEHWAVKEKEITSIIYGYYASRLVQCVQEVAVGDSKQKEEIIKDILNDPLTVKAMREGFIESLPLRIAAVPIRNKNIKWCIMIGKMMGFVKNHKPSLYYKIKSTSVNKAL